MKPGWEVRPLEQVATIGGGNPAPQNEAFFEGGTHPFIRTSDVGAIKVGSISDAADKLNDAGLATVKTAPRNSILFPKSGASTLLNHRVLLEIEAPVSSHLAWIQERIQQRGTGATVKGIKASLLKQIPVPMPDANVQEYHADRMDALIRTTDALSIGLRKRNGLLPEIRQSLLRQAFAGELT